MGSKRLIISLCVLSCLLFITGLASAASITDSNGMVVLKDGPNVSGDSFEIKVNYGAFDGIDASDPLGVTPGKKQFAYILEYVSGNQKMGFFTVESINAVPIIEAATSTTGIVNGVEAGTDAPIASGVGTLPSGNPAARFVYKEGGLSSFGLAGAKTVILVFTTDEKYDIQTSLAQIVDTSLSAAGEVVGPTECFGIIEGCIFCLDCGPDGEVAPMEGVTIKIISDGNEVASAITGGNGQYQVSGLGTGQYTVAVDEAGSYAGCSVDSVDVEVTCDSGAVASFCVCPPPCSQSICVSTACDQNSVNAWVGICGPQITRWVKTGPDGLKCFEGIKIVPGHYKVKVKAPCGYEVAGDWFVEFDLAECELKEVAFTVCPIPPCEETVCVTVVEVGEDGNDIPIEGVNITLRCHSGVTGVTGPDGMFCTNDLRPGYHVAIIEVPDGYRLCDGDNKISFRLNRCEYEDIRFELCKVTLGPCPLSPGYWKNHPESWPITSMWIGADILQQPALLNILNNMKADGSPASSRDMSMKLAKFLIAVKLNLANGSDPKDIDPVVIAADEFLLYDYPPGCKPRGKGKELARQLKNTLEEYINDNSYCEPSD